MVISFTPIHYLKILIHIDASIGDTPNIPTSQHPTWNLPMPSDIMCSCLFHLPILLYQHTPHFLLVIFIMPKSPIQPSLYFYGPICTPPDDFQCPLTARLVFGDPTDKYGCLGLKHFLLYLHIPYLFSWLYAL